MRYYTWDSFGRSLEERRQKGNQIEDEMDEENQEDLVVVVFTHCDHTELKSLKDIYSSELICFRQFKLNCGHVIKADCRSSVSSLICPEKKVTRFSYCDHIATGCNLDGQLVLCKAINTDKYPCGHDKPQFCYEDVGICTAICNEEMPCGHRCPYSCHPNERHPICLYTIKSCPKTCKRGHPCPSKGHFCALPCPPCNVSADEEDVLCKNCGRLLKCFCKYDYEREICQNNCKKTCKLNHPCKNRCGEECTCEVMVDKKHPLCGHIVSNVPCNVELRLSSPCPVLVMPNALLPDCMHTVRVNCGKEDMDPKLILELCKNPCSGELACGHLCAGNCWDCLQGRLHKRCTKECKRLLICGHLCNAPLCSDECPPCQAPCERSCKHRKCELICGIPCNPCEEDCGARCDCEDGLICSRKCHDQCTVVCDKPCVKILRCGHACIGFCGETCPTLCRVCNRDELEKGIFTGDPLTATQRFIQMDNCRHVIEKESLDGYIASKQDETEISSIGCPICRQPILQLKRYKQVLWINAEDKRRIYTNIYGSDEENRKEFQELLGTMCYVKRPLFRDFYKFLISKLHFTDDMNKVTLKTYKAYISLWQKCEDTCTELLQAMRLDWDRNNLLNRNKEFLNLLTVRKVPLTKSEVVDLNREALRLNDYFELLQIVREDQEPEKMKFVNRHSTQLAYRKALEVLFYHERYSLVAEDNFRQHLRIVEVDTQSQIKLDSKEKREVVQALKHQNRNGRWFKCRNGHPYIITECGGAAQASTCNVCEAPIGGENHVILPGNSLLEVDELYYPADRNDRNRIELLPRDVEPAPRAEPPKLMLNIQ